MKHVKISESDNPSKERIWDKQYQCRDFELSHFWQKAAFLFGFLSLCFGGYGALVLQVVDKDTNTIWLPYIYQYMCGISLLGIVLSVVWIYMMKGSKAWYEVYEKSIYAIEREIFQDNQQYVEGEFAKRIRGDFDTHLFGTKGGAFSPSRINIVIGWIILFVWCGCLFFSVYNLVNSKQPLDFSYDSRTILIEIGVVIAIALIVPLLIKPFIKSRPLLNESRNSFCKLLWHFVLYKVTPLWLINIMTKISDVIRSIIKKIVKYIYHEKKYMQFVRCEQKSLFTDELNRQIEMIVRDYDNDKLKMRIEKRVAKKNAFIEKTTTVDNSINSDIDIILEAKIKDNMDVIINKIIKTQLLKLIDNKIDKISSKMYNEIKEVINNNQDNKKL